MADKDERGRAGEARAARHLEQAGWRVLARNWRCVHGEIDIVAERGDEIAIVEVKTRRTRRFGHPLEAITPRKLTRLRYLAIAWVMANPERAWGRQVALHAVAITGDDPDTGALEHLEHLQ
ncbi:YraN family protein [Microbacterium sp. LRZ72]|uniref:YraN family protein n=1 Tax=Microbacterium sp. LRZ72 TaxID=2942481 RepID=UPI0029A618CE|nr:YraN family protein [Microbacterium sp. LRZ72]MDX2375569.1 YraN family protein [Microbacterium sp. LRZ72]